MYKKLRTFHFSERNTFCISLKKNEYRWIKMKDRFERDGLRVKQWKAATPSDLTDNFVDSITPFQKACSQSHINVWKHIVKYSLPYALILEDDACFDRNWQIRLQEFLDTNKDPEWDAIFLNVAEPTQPLYTWVPAKDQCLLAGYILSLKGAKAILEEFKNCFCASDWMTQILQRRGHSYTYFPWLIIQEGEDTLIGSNIEADHEKVKRCLGEIKYSLDNYNF
jgi:GR25 family glycosyltransferase involved in LPS biosynthesis